MAKNREDIFTEEDMEILIRDGHPALGGHISQMALSQIIDEYENDPRKYDELQRLRKQLSDANIVPLEKFDLDDSSTITD